MPDTSLVRIKADGIMILSVVFPTAVFVDDEIELIDEEVFYNYEDQADDELFYEESEFSEIDEEPVYHEEIEKEDDDVTFTATVENAESLQWQYSRDGVTCSNLKEGQYTGTKTNELKFKGTTSRLSLYFHLVATNEAGETVSDPVQFTIKALSDDEFSYKALCTTTCSVVKYIGDDVTSVTVPGSFQGMTVVEIGEKAFENRTSLVSVSLPNSIQVIGCRAFAGCTSLSSMSCHGEA